MITEQDLVQAVDRACDRTKKQIQELEGKNQQLTHELLQLGMATQLCSKHQPNGGARSRCLDCAVEEFSAYMVFIAAAVNGVHPHSVTNYDMDGNGDRVVQDVRAKMKELKQLQDTHWAPASIAPSTPDRRAERRAELLVLTLAMIADGRNDPTALALDVQGQIDGTVEKPPEPR